MANRMDRSKVVVVLEDDQQIRTLLAEILQNKGYYVVPVETGLRALEVMQQVRARLLVLDLVLPDMPGSRVLDLLHADEKTRDVPVLVLSGHLQSALNNSNGNGNDQVRVSRPFEIDQVIAEVQKLIGEPFLEDVSFNITGLLSPRRAFGQGAA